MFRKLNDSDTGLIVISLILLCFGLLMVYSSSAIISGEKKSDSFFVLKKQLLWTLFSITGFFLFVSLNYRYLQNISKPIFVFSIILLIAVLIFGKSVKGARRWFDLGPVDFQPAEFAKFAVVFFVADYIDKSKSKIKKFSGFIKPIGAVVILVFLISLQPDMGTPFVIGLTVIIMLFIGGAKLLHLVSLILLSIPPLFFVIISKSYRIERLFAFLNPWEYSQSYGYQLCQSLMSLGSGSLFGKGLGQSELKRFYLPEAHTDFIFSIIGEEMGFIGAVSIILAFTYFLFRGYKISKNATDFFGTLLAVGITATIVISAFFNFAVCTGSIPTKGIALPFLSYGGSSLVLTLCAVGILANISQSKDRKLKFRK